MAPIIIWQTIRNERREMYTRRNITDSFAAPQQPATDTIATKTPRTMHEIGIPALTMPTTLFEEYPYTPTANTPTAAILLV